RLDLLAGLELGRKLKEEPEFADFDSLFHDVHAIEVVNDNGFEDEVVLVRMARGLIKNRGELFAIVRMFLATCVPVIQQRSHSIETRAVQRLKNVQCSKKERTRTAGWIEHGDFADTFIESQDQVRPGILYHVLRELAGVKIICDQVVDVANFPRAQLASKFLASLAAINGLAPDFRRQTKLGRGGLVPARAAFTEVGFIGVYSCFDVIGKREWLIQFVAS